MFPKWLHEVPRDGMFGLGTVFSLCTFQEKKSLIMTQFPDNKGMLRASVMRHVGESRSGFLHLPLQQPLSARSSSETRAVNKRVSFGRTFTGPLQNRKPASPLQRLADNSQEAPSSSSPESGEEASKVVEHQLDQLPRVEHVSRHI